MGFFIPLSMKNKEQLLKEHRSKTTVIYFALLAGQLLFSAVALILSDQSEEISQEQQKHNDLFMLLVPIVMTIGVSAGIILSKQRIIVLRKKSTNEKMEGYSALFILKAALMEGPNLFAIITFLLTGNYILIMMAGLGILYFASFFPRKQKMLRELEITEEE